MHKCYNDHINSSPNIVITGSLVNTMWQRIMWPCTLPTTRDTHWPVVTPGIFRRTLPRLPDLKLIRSNLFCLNSARLDRIGKSDTLPDMSVWTQLKTIQHHDTNTNYTTGYTTVIKRVTTEANARRLQPGTYLCSHTEKGEQRIDFSNVAGLTNALQ